MAEIGILPQRSFSVPIQQFAPARIDTTPPPPPPVDLSGVARAQMFASIAGVLGNLPGQIMAGLAARRKEQFEKDKLAIEKQKAESDAKTSDAQAKMYSSHAAYYDRGGAAGAAPKATQGTAFYNQLNSQFGGAPATGVSIDPDVAPTTSGGVVTPLSATPGAFIEPDLPTKDGAPAIPAAATGDALTLDGSVFGLVPDGKGGVKQDPNDITDASVPGFSATKGAWGHDIKDPALMGAAITPAMLKAHGIDPDDRKQVAAHAVRVIGADGVPRDLDIVDKLGKGGRVDFTLAAYRALGGPETKNGGIIPGLKVQIVPKGAPAPAAETAGAPSIPATPASAAVSAPSSITIDGQTFDIPASALTAGNAGAPAAVTPAAPSPFSLDLDVRPTAPMLGAPVSINPAPTATAPAPSATEPPPGKVRFDNPRTGQTEFVNPEDVPVLKPPMVKNPATGVITVNSPGGQAYDVLPNGTIRQLPKRETQIVAQQNPDGTVVNALVDKDTGEVVKEINIRPTGRGNVQKLTDSQKQALGAAAKAAGQLNGIMTRYDELEKAGKVGPVAGRIQSGKEAIGVGDKDFATFNSLVQGNLFNMARALQGAGVLTEKDIQRMEKVAPSGNMSRDQFEGKLDAVKLLMLQQAENWKLMNAGAMDESQGKLVDGIISQLGGDPANSANNPASGDAPAGKESAKPAKVPAGMVLMEDPATKERRYVNPGDVEKAKKAGAVVVK